MHACLLACPGFPVDDDEEEEEVVHLLLYIPMYSSSVVCIRFKVYRYRTKPKPAPKLPTYLPIHHRRRCCYKAMLYSTPLKSTIYLSRSSRESHISHSALKVTLFNKYIET